MLNEEDYDRLQNSFRDSQRLFNKLNIVADNAEKIYYDDGELYDEESERYTRHWLKLSSKIVDALSLVLTEYNIELLKNDSLELRELTFNLIQDGVKTKIKVDFSENDSLKIEQLN